MRRGGNGSVARAVIRSRATKTRVSKPSVQYGQARLFTAPALDWLKAELAVGAKLIESDPPQAKAFIAQTLEHWQVDTDLAGLRGDKALNALPEAERAAWRTLWASVQALLEKARAAAGPAT